jgi:hypothetical protein
VSGGARGVHLARQEAVPSSDGRRCASCGDFIDPIDWCSRCRLASATAKREVGCQQPHRRARKRSDAAFCNDDCRHVHRSSFIRDCL